MRVASLKSESRDETLIVVNRSLTQAAKVVDISTMQFAIEIGIARNLRSG